MHLIKLKKVAISFRVLPVWFCRIYRMKKENIHIDRIGPDESLLLNYIRKTASEEEIRLVENWLKQDAENEQVLLSLAGLDHALRTKKRIESRDPLAAYSKVQKRIALSQRKVWLNRIYLTAACFIGVLIMSTAIAYWMQEQEDVKTQMITVQANAGMRTHFDLPDGTVAYLNSGSILTYPCPYDKEERRVSLTGEAYFKVAHNPQQPFVVSVADDRMRVKVLGTEFNLQSYKDESVVQTTLVSGSVSLEMVKNGNVVSNTKLRPSEKAVYDIPSGIVSIANVNTDYDTAWKDGRLMFKDMPLPQVLKKLAYFYNVKFEVQDPVINSYCFTGIFENKQLSQVLDYLKISSQIDYTIKQMRSDDSLGVQYVTVVLEKKR